MNWQAKAANTNRRARKKYPKAGKVTAVQVENLFYVAKNRCESCGKPDNLTVDHIVPLSLGGLNIWRNLQLLCLRCNQKKGAARTQGMGREIKRQQKILAVARGK